MQTEVHTPTTARDLNKAIETYKPSPLKPRLQAIISKTFEDGHVAEAVVAADLEDDEVKPMLLVGDGYGYQLTLNFRGFTAASPKTYPYQPYVFDSRASYEIPKTAELFEEVLAEVRRFIDLDDEYRVLLAASIMLSYVQERFETVPYIYLLGDNESGKTHALLLISYLAYRPLYGVSIPSADIFTYLGNDGFVPTIIEDEIQGIERDTDKSKIWKSGYKKGAKVPRIKIKANGEREMEHYNTFSLKFAAGEKLIKVKGLTERFIVIQMIEGLPEKDYYDEQDFLRFSKIRNKLLLWRINKLTDPRFAQLELPWLRGRMRELYLPLLAVLKETRYYSFFENFVKRMIEDRIEAKKNSLEGFLTKIVAKAVAEKRSLKLEFAEDIWARIKLELDAEESSSRPDRLETDAYGTLTKQKVGRRLREVLGSKVKREWENNKTRVYHVFKASKLLKAIRKYYIADLTDLTDLIDFLRDMAKEEVAENAVKAEEKPVSEAEEKPIPPKESVRTIRTVRPMTMTTSAPLGPTGLLVRLRRLLQENGRDMGLYAVCDEIHGWPLPPELKANDLPHQAFILKRLIRSSKYWKRRLDFGVTNRVLRIAE